MFRRLLIVMWLLTATSGCATSELESYASLWPGRAWKRIAIYNYHCTADVVYPKDSSRAEEIRMQWLETLLSANGYPDAEYEIRGRWITKTLAPDVYKIHYTVAVQR